MNGKVRGGLSVLAVAFTGYLAVGAFLWTAPVAAPIMFSSGVGLYLLCVLLCVFWDAVPVREPRPADAADPEQEDVRDARTRLPRWVCVLVLVAAAIVPRPRGRPWTPQPGSSPSQRGASVASAPS